MLSEPRVELVSLVSCLSVLQPPRANLGDSLKCSEDRSENLTSTKQQERKREDKLLKRSRGDKTPLPLKALGWQSKFPGVLSYRPHFEKGVKPRA